MAQRRMFSLKVVDTDAFLDMPQSSQLLYFHLAMRGDDDGFVANPKKIMRMLGINDDDYKLLVVKKFVIPFESGVCVIKHWRIHNYLQNDRYKETQYIREKEMLIIDEKTNKYSIKDKCIQNGYKMYPQLNLTKPNLTINNSDKSPINYKDLVKGMGISSKPVNTQQWQEQALEVIKGLNVPENKVSSVFKCFKDNPQKSKIAYLDCKELGKLNVNYFFKVFSELSKKTCG